MAGKGQVSVETMIIVGILLLLFVGILVYNSLNSATNASIREYWIKEIECNKYAEIISSIYNKGHGAEWHGTLYYNIIAAPDSLFVYEEGEDPSQSVYCRHFAEVPKTFIRSAGNVVIININGQVWFKNETA